MLCSFIVTRTLGTLAWLNFSPNYSKNHVILNLRLSVAGGSGSPPTSKSLKRGVSLKVWKLNSLVPDSNKHCHDSPFPRNKYHESRFQEITKTMLSVFPRGCRIYVDVNSNRRRRVLLPHNYLITRNAK